MTLTQVTTGGVDENINIDNGTLVIDGTNNRIGIGDAAPSERLNVAGNVMLEGSDQFLYYTNVGTGNSGIYIRGRDATSELRSHSTGIHTWEISGSEKMRLAGSGLGVGTAAPDQLLTLSSGSDTNLKLNTTNSTAHNRINFVNSASSASGGLWYSADNKMEFRTANNQRMQIDSVGRLMLGTSVTRSGGIGIAKGFSSSGVPAAGTSTSSLLVGNDDGGSYGLAMGANGSGNGYIQAQRSDGNTTIYDLFIQPNGGKVAIGTQVATANLNVYGGASATLFQNSSTGTGSSQGMFVGNWGGVDGYLWNYENAHLRFGTNSTERFRISSNGRVAIGSSSSDYKLYISGSGSSSAADQTLYMDAGGNHAVQLAMANGYNRRQGVTFINNGSASNTSFGLISENTQLHIKTASYAIGATTDLSSGWNTQAIFDNAGGFYVGDNGDYSQGNYAQTSGNGNFYFRKDNGSNGGAIVVATNADRGWSNMYLNRFDWSSGDDSRYIAFMRNGQSVTSINLGSNGTTVVYNTGSDYRLKENIVPMANGIARVKQLQPKQFTMIGDPNGVLTDGFLAHEAQTVVPVAVTGTHNAMTTDEDGNEVPDYQGMDYGQLTPLLTAALQEAIAKIETLETKVAALEAAG